MAREVFIVKNNTINDIELKDFGIIIPSGVTIELSNYDKSLLSDELNGYLISGDIIRLIDGTEMNYDESYLTTTESITLYTPNYIIVSKTGGTFNTIQGAIDSITDASSTNKYFININGGDYYEDVTLKDNVYLQGVNTCIVNVYGQLINNITGSTSFIKVKDIRFQTTDRPTASINTDGKFYVYDCAFLTTWTDDSNIIKPTFDIKKGEIDIAGQTNIMITDTYTGTTETLVFCYYINGSGSVRFRSDKTVHLKNIYGNYQKIGLLFNNKSDTNNKCLIKDSITDNKLFGDSPNNTFYIAYHSGSTSETTYDAVNITFVSQNDGTNVKCIGAYNSYSHPISGSTIDMSFCSFDWNDQIIDDNVYIGAVLTENDNIRIISSSFETTNDTIPLMYINDGDLGVYSYNIYNGKGTLYNSDLILTNRFAIGDLNSLIMNDITDDTTLSSNSVEKLVTEHAIKSYVDNQVPNNAYDLIYSNNGWVGTSGTTGDFLDDLSNVVTYTNGTGYIGIQDTVQQTGTNEITVLSGSGYISYDNIHKYITWSGFTIDTSIYSEGSWCLCFDKDNNFIISQSGITFFDKIQIAQFYKTGNVLGGVQSSGRRLDGINTRIQDYAFRMGSFIYDNGGTVETLGSVTGDTAMKLIFNSCNVQNVMDNYTIPEVTTNEGTTNFFAWFIDSDVSAKIDYSFIINNSGKINTKSYNDLNGQSDYQITGGTLSFTQYSNTVTSISNLTSEINVGDYIYAQPHTSVYMNRVNDITYDVSGTTITLEFIYLATSITGATGIAVKSLKDIPDGKYAKHLIIRASDGKTHMIYSQQYYDTRSDALSGPLPGYNDDIERFTIKVAAIIVTPGMTTLGGQIVDLRPLPFSSASTGGGGGITNHGDLSGLGNDDHLQYLLTNGTRNITGIQRYQSQPSFSTDLDIVTKKYVDDGLLLKSNTDHTHTVSSITDINTYYYNKTQINSFFSGTTSISGYNKTNWDTAYSNTHTHTNKIYLDAVGNNTIWHVGNLNKNDVNLITNKLIIHREIGQSSIIAGNGQGDYSLYLDSLSSGTTHINHYTTSDIFMVHGGGNVAIGAESFDILNPEKLLVQSFSDSVNIISAKGNLDDYLQLDIKNISGGTYSSADLVASNDLSTEDSYYVDLGINSSNYSDPDFSMSGPNDSYLYASGGHLSIATETVNKYIKFFVGGTTSADQRAVLDTNGNFGINSSTFTSKLQVADRVSKVGQTPNILSLRSDDTSTRMELLFTRNSNTSWDIQSIEQTVENKPLRLNPNGGDVSVNNFSIWHVGNFNPDSKANTGTTLSDYGILDAYTVSETNDLLDEKSFTGHTHTESEIIDLDHNAQKIKDKVIDDSNIGDGNVLIYDETSDTIKYKSVLDTMPSIQARRTSDFNVTTSWSDVTFSLTDIENKPSVLYWDNINTERFYVIDSGYYSLTFQTKVTCTTTTTQTSVQMLMNGTDIIEGSDTYINVYQGEVHPLISSTIAYLSGGTYITVQVIRNQTSSTLLANPRFIMYKMDGIKGDKGDTGSGSNIYVQSSGTTVLNGPHSVLNFTGVNVNVFDSGGGVAEVNINVSSTLSTLQIERTTDFISTTSWQNITFDTTVVQTDADNLYLDLLNTDRIYLEKSGIYFISTKVIPTNTTSQRHDIRLIKNGTTFIDGSGSFIDIYSSESHELTINTLFNANAGDYITLQGQSEVGGTFQSDTSMLLIRLEGIKGDKGDKGDTVIGPEGPSGERGQIGYGLFAYAKVQSDGTLDGSINLSVSKSSTGVYDYTFLTGTTDTTYGVYAQPFGTLTDTNSQISNVTNSGFTVSLGVGDNGGTNDVLTDTEHSVVIFGPPSILSGATSGGSTPLTIEDEGVDVGVTSVENINFIGDLVTATNAGGNSVNVTISNPTNSPVIVQNETSNVTNTPHTILNFTGNGVTVTDGGSGVADITIQNIYGSNFQYVENNTSSTTTATTPQIRQTLTTSNLPLGTYKISVNWTYSRTSVTNSGYFDVQVDGITQGQQMSVEIKDTTDILPLNNIYYLSNISGSKTITFRYWNEGSSTTIFNSSIEIIRVS